MTPPDRSTVSPNLPPVFLNHVYVVLDAATYDDVERSAFLQEVFAPTERRTTSMSGECHTALYFYGLSTYFEFFNAADLPSPGMADSGIALGVDESRDLQKFCNAAKPDFIVEEKPVTRQWGEKQVPWFYAGANPHYSNVSNLPVWLMEYHPRFLTEWHPQLDSHNEGVRRAQVLQRYTAVLKNVPTAPLFKDVVGLTLATDKAVRKELLELAELLGYDRRSLGETEILNGTDLELRLTMQEGGSGVRALALRVEEPPEKQADYRFGPTSVLQFHGNGLATWSFG